MTKYGDKNRYNLTNYEKETILNYNDEEKDGTVYSCNAAMIRRMDRLAAQYPDEVKQFREDEVSKSYYVPKGWIKVNPPKKIVLSDEQKAIRSERLKEIRSRQNKK